MKIDIPGFQQQLAVNGYIETDGFPIVILSRSQNIYAETNLESYLQNFVYDAIVEVSDGSSSVALELMEIAALPLESRKRVAEMLRVELDEVLLLPIKVYSTVDFSMKGVLGMSYTLSIQDQGKLFTSVTSLLAPVPLANVSWTEDAEFTGFGRCLALFSDPPNEDNSYKWEVKRINTLSNGQPWDIIFRSSGSPYFNDEFWDGLTFEFDTRYPKKDTSLAEDLQRLYRFGDTVVIKMSTVERSVFEFFDKKESQLLASANPFSAPVNIPTNISGGCLGVWAGISPWYDTLFCQ